VIFDLLMEPAVAPQLLTVANGVHAWIGAGGDSNAGAIETADGMLIVDAQQYPRLARQFRDRLRSVVDRPVIELINTHCHLDHTAGNIVFSDVPIIAHTKTLAAMSDALGPKSGEHWTVSDYATKIRFMFGQNLFELVPENDPGQAWFRQRIGLPDYDTMVFVPPTKTFADRFAYHLPNDTVHLEYWGPAFLGDLLFFGRFPWLGDCDLNGWIDRLAGVLSLDIDVVIPGHGPPTDLAQVARFRDMLMALRNAVEVAIEEHMSEEAAVREVQLPQYADIPRYRDWMPVDVRAAYRYLSRRRG